MPSEYRSFLTEVSAGGAGPGFGLFLFDRSDLDENSRLFSWNCFSEPTDFYRSPFAATVATVSPEEIEHDPDAAVRGTWVLADYGCSIYTVLALSGRATGDVWWVDGLDLYPAHLTFADWYTTWLDEYAAEQTATTEIRTGWASYISTETWFARVIHNAIREHDPDHTFTALAPDHTRLFDIDALEADSHRKRLAFRELLDETAADLNAQTRPRGDVAEFTPQAAAALLRSAAERLIPTS